MSYISRAIWRAYKPAKPHHHDEPNPSFSIKLHEDGKVIHGLTIEDHRDGERNLAVLPAEHRRGSLGNLVHPGIILFNTAKGKRWQVRLDEFSFLFNSKMGKPNPEPETPAPAALPAAA